MPQGSHHRFTQLRDSHRVTPQGHTTGPHHRATTGPHHRATTGQEPLESNRSTAVLEAASLRTLTMRPTTETTRGSFHRSVKCCSGNTIPSGNNTKQNNDSNYVLGTRFQAVKIPSRTTTRVDHVHMHRRSRILLLKKLGTLFLGVTARIICSARSIHNPLLENAWSERRSTGSDLKNKP